MSFLIQRSPDQCLFAAPRSLSQLITSFIGSQCQGIRPAPLFAWPFKRSFKNIWYPLDSLLPTKIIVTLPFEIAIFLKKELTIIFVSQLLFSFQGTSLSSLFRALKIEQYLLYSFKPVQGLSIFWCPVLAWLLRKEVIQPQVLLRLPCYDFTLIICPTLGGGLLKRLSNRLWVLQTLMVWRAVCTRPGNVFTVACWSTITSDSNFMQSSCRLQSELRTTLRD